MKNFKQLFAAFALVAAASSVSAAQSDFGSPLGGGSGVGGAVAPLGLPSVANQVPPSARDGWARSQQNFASAPAVGVRVINPAGGTVNLPQNVAQALGAVMGGSGSEAQRGAVAAAIGPNGASVADALAALGANPSMAALGRAIAAYNAAVDAIPAGQAPSAALMAARQALWSISQSAQ